MKYSKLELAKLAVYEKDIPYGIGDQVVPTNKVAMEVFSFYFEP